MLEPNDLAQRTTLSRLSGSPATSPLDALQRVLSGAGLESSTQEGRKRCDALCTAADHLLQQGRYQQAIALAQIAETRDPGAPGPLVIVSSVMIHATSYAVAKRAAEAALEKDSRNIPALTNLAIALVNIAHESSDLDLYARAARCAVKVLDLASPTDARRAHIHAVLGMAYYHQLELTLAESHFDKAIELDSNSGIARNFRGLTRLLAGRLPEGFADLNNFIGTSTAAQPIEIDSPLGRRLSLIKSAGVSMEDIRQLARHALEANQTTITESDLWDGSELAGRTLLIRSEGAGLGDVLNFVRYAAVINRGGGRIVLQCQPRLLPLLQRARGIDAAVPIGSTPSFDVWAPVMSLPGLCGTTTATIPTAVPYLSVEPKRVEHWRQRIGAADRLKIGIVWQCGDKSTPDWRSMPGELLFSLADIPGVKLFSFQRSKDGKNPEEVPDQVVSLEEREGTMVDSAAAMMCMDLMLTVDTMQAHVAGALALPTWLLLPFCPDWRWMLDRSDTPWYRSMRLFRQPKPGDWASVLRNVTAELSALAERV